MNETEEVVKSVMRPYYLARARDARRERRTSFWFAVFYALATVVYILIAAVSGDPWWMYAIAVVWGLLVFGQVWLWRSAKRREADWLRLAI